MALFARELRWVAYQTDSCRCFVSLVGLSKRKGRNCIKFLLCQYVLYLDFSREDTFKMMLIEGKDLKSVDDVNANICVLWPESEEDVGKIVASQDARWVDAIPQLYDVVVGRWYGASLWGKVSMPRKWRGKSSITLGRDEKRARKGLARIFRLSQKEKRKLADIRALKEIRSMLWRRRRALKIYNVELRDHAVSPLNQKEYDRHSKSIERINQEISWIATKKTKIDSKFLVPQLSLVKRGLSVVHSMAGVRL